MTIDPDRHRLSIALLMIFWLSVAMVTIGSIVPGDMLPPQTMNIWDKAQHALGFAWLAACGLMAFPRRLVVVVVGLTVWGGVIEILQAASGWRQGDWVDWLADIVGVALAVAVWRYMPAGWARRA